MDQQPTVRQASVALHTERVISEISPLIFGGFAEHMGRCIYEGIYDPASPLADSRGFRPDVMCALKDINYRIMRYPGGNFVSGYHWQDGIGPREKRPRRRALAWRSIETNQFGPDEFMEFASAVSAAIPTVIAYLLFQRRVTEGVMAAAGLK